MDNALRLQYLQAMGIDVWIPRQVADSIAEQAPTPLAQLTPCYPETQSETPLTTVNWETLQRTVASCQRCALAGQRNPINLQITPQSPNQTARWLLIMDEPNTDTDSDSESMLILNEMLQALGLKHEDVLLTSALKCPLPKARAPHREELAECRSYLEQQITLLQPKIILLLGQLAARSLLQTDASLNELRGIIHKFAAISTIVTYHPKFLLRALLEKRNAWQDLQLAMTAYQEVNRL